jgi:adenine-specific DNA-methyltransferase
MNLLINSENVNGLNYLLNEKKLRGKIDLIYIDPPFATGRNFTITKDRVSTVSVTNDGYVAYTDTLKGDEYISFLRERLLILRDLLSEKGSIYLHIDYKIGHYVKVMMDEVFGIENFRNDITRIKCNPKNFKRIGYGNIKDMILFYTKSSTPIWNEPKEDFLESDIIKLFPKIDKNGRRYTTVSLHAPGETKNSCTFKGLYPPPGRHWSTSVEKLLEWDNNGLIEWSSNGNPRKIMYLDESEGKRVQDIWEFKDPQHPIYPTEKNIDLLNRIIKTSSNEGSIVLDCFCGSGTTLLSAQQNNRNWIGIDQSDVAIEQCQKKLESSQYELIKLDN